MGRPLVVKLVKPIKIAGSGSTSEFQVDQWLISKAQAQMGAVHTAVSRKANPAVLRKLPSRDLANG